MFGNGKVYEYVAVWLNFQVGDRTSGVLPNVGVKSNNSHYLYTMLSNRFNVY